MSWSRSSRSSQTRWSGARQLRAPPARRGRASPRAWRSRDLVRLAARRRASRRRTRGSSRASRSAARRRPRRARTRLWSTSSPIRSTTSPPISSAGPHDRRRPCRGRSRRGTPTADRASRRAAVVEQVVAPGDRAAQRLLALRQVARAGRQQRQVVVEPGEDLVRRQQLDRGRRRARSRAASRGAAPRSPATAGALAFVTAKPGRTARRPGDEQADGLELVERVEVELAQLARQVEPLHLGQAAGVGRGRAGPGPGTPARPRRAGRSRVVTRQRDVRAAAQELGDDRAGVDDLLEVVEDEQHVARRRSSSASASMAGRAALSASAERPGDRRGDEGRVADGVEGDEPDAVGEVVGGGRGDLERQPRLAGAARSGQGQQPGRPASSAPASASSRSRPTNVVSWVGRLFGRASSERSGGKSAGRPSMTSWVEPLRRAQVLEPVLPEVAQARRRRAASSATRARVESRQQDLAAVGGGGDPGRAVDGVADDVRRRTARARRCAGPSGRGPTRRPATAPRRARAARRRPPRRPPAARRKMTKNESPSVPCSWPSWAANAARRSARCRSRTSRYGPVPSVELEAGRALDVAEQAGDGAGRRSGVPGASSRRTAGRQWRSASVSSRSRPASPRMTASATAGSLA